MAHILSDTCVTCWSELGQNTLKPGKFWKFFLSDSYT